MMGLMVLAFYATYRISLVASQLASPPRLRRPSSFGNVQLGNPSLASINLQSLSLASFALVIQLILGVLYLTLRTSLKDVGGIEAPDSGLPAVVLSVATGWLQGMARVVKRNGPSSESPALQNYTLLLRPYPMNPWLTSVANRAAFE